MTESFPQMQREEKEKKRDRFFKIRNLLNIIFIVGAVAGMIIYFFTEQEMMGIIIILTAMFFKMAECSLRFIR